MPTSVPGLRATKKAQTREQIGQAAIELFVQRGFDAVSIADIAERAMVSKATVFNYFPAKEDIFLFVAADSSPDFVAAAAAVRTETGLVDAISDYVRQAIASRAEWSGLHEGSHTFTGMIEASTSLTRAVHHQWAMRRQAFADAAVERLTEPGAAPADQALVRVLAAQVVATVEELTALNRTLAESGDDEGHVLHAALALHDQAFGRLRKGVD